MNRLLDTFDEWATQAGIDDEVGAPSGSNRHASRPPRPRSTSPRRDPHGHLGHRLPARPPWVDLPVFDHKGGIRHDGGVVSGAPGVYVLGLNVLRRRRSSFIGGAAGDTAELAPTPPPPRCPGPSGDQLVGESSRQPLFVALWRPAPVNDEQPVELGQTSACG